MASGQELFQRFQDATDSQYELFEDSTRANRLMSTAYRNVVARLLNNASNGTENIKELKHLYAGSVTVVPTSNSANLSAFSGTLYWPIAIKAKFISAGVIYYFSATDILGSKFSELEKPTIRYPKYEIDTSTIKIYPNNNCSEITADYYKSPTDINTQSSTDLAFDPLLDDMIVREAVIVASSPNRDSDLYQLAQNNQITNKDI